MNRGDVVLVDFPFADGSGSKIRPALVVQSDAYNAKLASTILAMITGSLTAAGDPACLLIDPGAPEGASSGLHGRSLLKCHNLLTISQKKVLQTIGRLSAVLMTRVDGCLKVTLTLP